MSPDEYCRDKLAAPASSDHYSLLFLPAQRRRVATALSALRRELHEAAQRPSDASVAQASLGWWAQEVQRAFQGTAQHPVTRALAPHVDEFQLSLQPIEALLQGHAREAQSVAFEDFAAWVEHCDQARAPFLQMMAGIYGPLDEDVRSYARHLALALQLIRALRDCGREARQGRVVFPLHDLRHFEVPAQDLASAHYGTGFAALAQLQARRAREALNAAAACLPAAQRRNQAPGIILANLYRTLLDEMERTGFQVLHQRIALTPIRKLLIAWRTWVLRASRGGAWV